VEAVRLDAAGRGVEACGADWDEPDESELDDWGVASVAFGFAMRIPRVPPDSRLPLGFSDWMIWSDDGLLCAAAGSAANANGAVIRQTMAARMAASSRDWLAFRATSAPRSGLHPGVVAEPHVFFRITPSLAER
jgi:hypothetical protein